MTAILWVLVVIWAFGFAYVRQFSSVTLSFGRELSDTGSATGFQDAVTPPWQTTFAIVIYIGVLATVAVMWWQAGGSALGGAAAIFLGSSLAKLALPKPSGAHYKRLIAQSMWSRYADYVRIGDSMRAEAMKHLLSKAGLNPDDRGAG